MGNEWFESVAVAQRRARRRLPASVYNALVGGADAGVSMHDNVNAYSELGIRPVTAARPPGCEIGVTVMGQPCSMPVLISPTGVQAVHPEAEVAVASAAASRGVPMGLSSFATMAIEPVIKANPKTFFQLYWAGDTDSILARCERARAAGAVGLILTLDWSFVHSRDWGSPSIPQDMGLATILRHAPETVRRPRYLWSWLRRFQLPTLGVPNFAVDEHAIPGFFEAYGTWMATPPPTWDDVAWLAESWAGPFMIKGVSRADEARRARDAGATAISVSNHGGNNVDGAPASIRVLPEISAAVGDDIEVLLDGGIRRGSDVVKAVALGADAVMIAEPTCGAWQSTARPVSRTCWTFSGPGLTPPCRLSGRSRWPLSDPTTSSCRMVSALQRKLGG